MLSTLVLIICAVLYGGVLVVLFQRNSDLAESVKSHEEHIRELEKYLNPTEKDSMIRSRLSTTETRVTSLDRSVKSYAADLEVVTKQVQSLMNGAPVAIAPQQGKVAAGDNKLLDDVVNELRIIHERVGSVASRVDLIVTAQNNLAMKALLMEHSNVCVFASQDSCPPRTAKVATFGVIAHSGQSPIPQGYFTSAAFNDNGWNWFHGSLCCSET